MATSKSIPAKNKVPCSQMELDSTDRRIIGELYVHSCIPLKKLASHLRTSEQKTQYRINRLLSCGAIHGFPAIIDYSKIGYYALTVNYVLSAITAETEKRIVGEILKTDSISIFRCDGRWNLSVTFLARDDTILDTIYLLKRTLSPYVVSADLIIRSQVMQFPISKLLSNSQFRANPIFFGSSRQKIEIDEKDMRILCALGHNARLSTLELARLVNIPPRTAAYRKKRLIKEKVLVGCSADIDPNLPGLHFYRVYVALKSPTFQLVNSMLSFIASQEQTVRVGRTISRYELFYDLAVSGGEEFRAIKQLLEDRFPDQIMMQEHMRIYKEPRFGYFFP